MILCLTIIACTHNRCTCWWVLIPISKGHLVLIAFQKHFVDKGYARMVMVWAFAFTNTPFQHGTAAA